jgi:hypothetical protein
MKNWYPTKIYEYNLLKMKINIVLVNLKRVYRSANAH